MDISIPGCKYDCTFNVEEAARMNPTMEALLRVAILGDEAPSRTKIYVLIWGCYASIRVAQLLINKYRGSSESPASDWGKPDWEELWDMHDLADCFDLDDTKIDLDALNAIEGEARRSSLFAIGLLAYGLGSILKMRTPSWMSGLKKCRLRLWITLKSS